MMTFVTIILAFILLMFAIAFLYSSKFRKDVLKGQGKVTVLGVLDAKGKTFLVIMALVIGVMTFTASKSSLKLDKLAKVVPEEAPNLSEIMNDDIQALKESHLSIINKYFEGKRKEVEVFFECKYLPTFSRIFAENDVIREDLARALSSNNQQELSTVLSELNSAQQQTLLHKRAELLEPIDKAEKEVIANIDSQYNRILTSNNTITELLKSLR